MAGFYGKISNSNRSAFTFDIKYPTRYAMDTQCATDGVFLGRYVLVEYDDPPIQGYRNPQDGNFYTDSTYTKIITPVGGRLYQDIQAVNTSGSFYIYDSKLKVYTSVQNATEGFAANYNIDVIHYGRGYDSTVWMKTADTSTGEYKYVLVAELNTVVPNFHLVLDPPTANPVGPFFDGQTTNLDYYMHVQMPYGWRINEETDPTYSDQKIRYRKAVYDEYNKKWSYDQNEEKVNGAIFYNRAGFLKETRSKVEIGKYYTLDEQQQNGYQTVDSINYTMGRTGRLYQGTDNTPGVAKDDLLLWHVYLPSIGNAICDVWDYMFTTDRKLNFLDENAANRNYVTYDTGSVLGVANSLRFYIGRVWDVDQSIESDGYTARAAYTNGNSIIRYKDTTDERTYYYPTYTNQWTQGSGANFTYYYDETAQTYKLANKAALPSGTKYYSKISESNGQPYLTYAPAYSRSISGAVTGSEAAALNDANGGLPSTLYGLIAYTNCLLGTSLKQEDSRDERTVIGLMNRMRDIIVNIDTQLVPTRWVMTTEKGQVTTTDVPYTAPIAGGVLDSVGNWVPRWYSITITGDTDDVGELTTNNLTVEAENSKLGVAIATTNKWIRLAADNTTKVINIAHALCGIEPTTIVPSATGWAANGNELKIPQITFDEAGHITGYSTKSFYLPNYFKMVNVSGSSQVDTGSTGANNVSIDPDSIADTAIFATANKWITINCNANTITWGHAASGVTNGTYGLTQDMAVADLDGNNQFNVPTFDVDKAGHITKAETHVITLPESIHTLVVAVGNTGTAQLTVADTPTQVVADSLEDIMTFYAANKWLRIAADIDNDEIRFAHEIHTVTETTPTINFNDNNKLTFTADELTWDEAGHLTARAKTTYTLPYNWKTVTVVNTLTGVTGISAANASAIATTPIDTLTLTSANKWLLLSADGTGVTIAHALSGIGAVANKGTGSAITTQYGMKFKVPYLSIDEAGHVIALSDTELTMPSISLTNGTGNVVTGLTLNSTNGAFIETKANIGNLTITGYTIATTSNSLAEADTLNAALGKLEKRIQVIESDYLKAAALNPYLLSDTAAETYLSKTDASTTYLTKTDASSTYLTQTDATSTYLSKTDASTIYLTKTDATDTYLTKTDASTAYQAKENAEDPYAITSYVDQAITDAIAAIARNYSLTLIAPEVSATYAENTITPSVNAFDGEGTIWLEKIEDSIATAVTEVAQVNTDELPTYPIDANGTYRVCVERTYNGSTVKGMSEEIVVDDIV